MSKGASRDVLLDAGQRIFLERGYNHSGIESILRQAGVPKGSFYHYFGSKEDFGLQVLNRFADGHHAQIEIYLGDTNFSPLTRLRRLAEGLCARLDQLQCRNGCMVGNLSLEMAEQSEVFRARLEEIFRSWAVRIEACLREAQAVGELPAGTDAGELAEFWLNSWEGAVLRAKTSRDTAPLRTFVNLMFDFVLKK